MHQHPSTFSAQQRRETMQGCAQMPFQKDAECDTALCGTRWSQQRRRRAQIRTDTCTQSRAPDACVNSECMFRGMRACTIPGAAACKQLGDGLSLQRSTLSNAPVTLQHSDTRLRSNNTLSMPECTQATVAPRCLHKTGTEGKSSSEPAHTAPALESQIHPACAGLIKHR